MHLSSGVTGMSAFTQANPLSAPPCPTHETKALPMFVWFTSPVKCTPEHTHTSTRTRTSSEETIIMPLTTAHLQHNFCFHSCFLNPFFLSLCAYFYTIYQASDWTVFEPFCIYVALPRSREWARAAPPPELSPQWGGSDVRLGSKGCRCPIPEDSDQSSACWHFS